MSQGYTGGGPPTGSAGGDLTGTYPNPTVATDAITYGKMQNVSAASRLLGRGSAGGAGDVEEISLGSGISLSGTTLSATGSGGTIGGSTGATDNAALRADGAGGSTVQSSSMTIADDLSGEVGYINIPQNPQSTNYTAVLADRGKHLYHPTTDDNPRTFTIPANASVAYAIGTAITFINDQNTLTIAITSDTLVWAEDGSTGSRTLAENGMATAVKVTSTRWIISGTGLS